MAKKNASESKNSTASIGFEAKLWLAADKLRNNMDAAEYKHVVLEPIFLKYISDTFEEHRAKLATGLQAQFAQSAHLEKLIKKNLKGLGFSVEKQ